MASYQPAPLRKDTSELPDETAAAGRHPPLATMADSESGGPSFGTPEWEVGEDELEPRAPVTGGTSRAATPTATMECGHEQGSAADSYSFGDVIAIGGDSAACHPPIGRGVGGEQPMAHWQKAPGGRPPYIDYSYSRRLASPTKQRPSILSAAAATYGHKPLRADIVCHKPLRAGIAAEPENNSGNGVRQGTNTKSARNVLYEYTVDNMLLPY